MLDLIAQAKQRHVAGDIGAAKSLYLEVLKANPQHADAWYHLGVICYQIKQYDLARQAMENAIAMRPDFAIACDTLGNLYWDIADFDKAIDNFRRATALAPKNAQAWFHLASALALNGDLQGAVAAYWEVIHLTPKEFWPHLNLAEILHRLWENISAETIVRHAIKLKSDVPQAWTLLARTLVNQGRAVEAADCINKIIERWVDDDDALLSIAEILGYWKAYDYAAQFYRLMLTRRPDHPLALSRLVDIHLSLCDWKDFDQFVALVVGSVERFIKQDSAVPLDIFNLQAVPIPQHFVLESARQRSRVLARRAEEKKAALNLNFSFLKTPHGDGGRIRVGYLMPYTHRSSLPLAIQGLIEQHDRKRFEIVGYSLMACDLSEESATFRNTFDKFTYMVGWRPEVAARRLHADGIDVMIDTTGHTSVHWQDVIAYRPAPIIAHYLGYSITTGADYVDYLISDKRYIPPEWQQYCSEKLVYLPDSFMTPLRGKISDKVFTRASQDLPEDGFVFANFNHPCKFEPSIFDIWMRILKRVPGSVLWLCDWIPKSIDNLRREAEQRGVSGTRLVLAKREAHADHLSRLRLADLVLDNRYHGGGVTTLDALWAGVPVLSCAGERPAARLGATLLSAAGMLDLVTTDLAEYERQALIYAENPALLASVRARVAKCQTSPLFDPDRYRRHVEHAYEMMWKNYCAGRPPQVIEVPAL